MYVREAARAFQWFFGWIPRSFLKNIQEVEEKIIVQSSDDDELEEIEMTAANITNLSQQRLVRFEETQMTTEIN